MSIELLNASTERLIRGLDIAARSHRLTAENVANVDTPGYKPRHLDFAAALDAATGELELSRTDGRHLAGIHPGPAVTVDLTPRRPDGNAVDPEREMADLTANAGLYATLAQAVRGRLHALRAAIEEGQQS